MVDLQDNADGWTYPRDVRLEVNYPIQGGVGTCITFVELTVFHVSLLILRLIFAISSLIAKNLFGWYFPQNSYRDVSAQFTCGDIYFRNFGIEIRITGTTYYSYRAMIYGVL